MDINSQVSFGNAGLQDLWQRLVVEFIRGRRRYTKIGIALLFTIVVCAQAALHVAAADKGRPYENWDELTGYNTAHVLSGPTDTSFRYGSLDSVLQWIAVIEYQYFDPIGRAYPHTRYANNAPPSWSDPLVCYQPKSWKGIDCSGFRGTDDHYPILLSRTLHLGFVYAVVLAIGLAAIAAYGGASVFVLAPLLALTVTPAVYFHTTQSLPNAANAMLTFGVVLFAMIYCDKYRLRYLLISVALLAVGLNFKTDVLLVTSVPALALCYVAWRKGLAFASRAALWALLLAVAVTVITRPSLLSDPIMDTRIRYHWLIYASSVGNPRHNTLENWRQFLAFIEAGVLWAGAGRVLALIGVGLALLAAFAGAAWRRQGSAPILVIGAGLAVVAWATAVRVTYIPEQHYYFNGYAAFLATIAIAMVFAHRKVGAWRVVAQAGLIGVSSIWAVHAVAQSTKSIDDARLYANYEGLDPEHHRNLASLDAIRTIRERRLAETILIDQHAYIDLRVFRLHGLDARYVNLRNLDQTVAALDPSKSYIVVFSRGNFDRGDGHLRGWEGDWSPELERFYGTYQDRLLKQRVVRHYPGTPQPVLSSAPIRTKDEIFVSVLDPKTFRTMH